MAARKRGTKKPQVDIDKLAKSVLEPYALELGLLLHAWNDLHIKLSLLFLAICDSGPSDEDENRDLFLAIWNAVPNDRMQRKMLRDAAIAKFSRIGKRMDALGFQIDLIRENEELELKEILWVLDSADTLGRKRDDSAHMPVTFYASDVLELVPQDFLEHPIATKMAGKNLVDEFSLQRERINAVGKHAYDIWKFMAGFERQPWPKRPAWPNSPPSKGTQKTKKSPTKTGRKDG